MRSQNPDFHILRILDANVNRAVEGIRVIEEVARMVFDDRSLTTSLKNVRHAIVSCIHEEKSLDRLLLSARRADKDIFRESETESEKKRDSLLTIVQANATRAQEAVRTLEEFVKLAYPHLSKKFKRIRFQLYDMEKILISRIQLHHLVNKKRLKLFAIVTNTNPDITDVYDKTRMVIDCGAGTIGYKNTNSRGKIVLSQAENMMDACDGYDVTTIIFNWPDIAKIIGTDGVHLEADDIPVSACRNITGDDFVIGVSVILGSQSMGTAQVGAHYLIIEQLHMAKRSKNHTIKQLSEIAATAGIPVVIMVDRYDDALEEVFDNGAVGVALPLNMSDSKILRTQCDELVKLRTMVHVP